MCIGGLIYKKSFTCIYNTVMCQENPMYCNYNTHVYKTVDVSM